jgi:hypothetical protein
MLLLRPRLASNEEADFDHRLIIPIIDLVSGQQMLKPVDVLGFDKSRV